MSDVLEDLRSYAVEKAESLTDYGDGALLFGAVHEIERLRREVTALQAIIEGVALGCERVARVARGLSE